MTISIRRGKLTDLESIAEAQMAMAMESEGFKLDGQRLRDGIRGVFERPERGTYWLAESAGKVVGMLLVVSEWSDWRNREIWWIHSVYTWPAFRGKGVYKSLYSALKKEVESRDDLGGLRLYVEQENTGAQEVYRKCGMKSDHYFMYEWLK
jgi:GNAT superfamily N-acetyltransferase